MKLRYRLYRVYRRREVLRVAASDGKCEHIKDEVGGMKAKFCRSPLIYTGSYGKLALFCLCHSLFVYRQTDKRRPESFGKRTYSVKFI